jgi:hypothetical protein
MLIICHAGVSSMIRRVALAVGGGSTKKNNITIRALITRKYPDNNSTALSSVKFIKNFMNINKNHIDKSIIKDIRSFSGYE